MQIERPWWLAIAILLSILLPLGASHLAHMLYGTNAAWLVGITALIAYYGGRAAGKYLG